MNINAAAAKQMLSFAARNKNELGKLLMSLDPEDPASGKLSVTEPLANSLVAELTGIGSPDPNRSTLPIEELSLQFQDGLVLVHVRTSAEKKISFLPLHPSFTLKFRIQQIHFNHRKHKIMFTSENGFALRSILNAAASRTEALSLEDDRIVFDLDRTLAAGKIPPWLSLVFLSCKDGRLDLAYQIKE